MDRHEKPARRHGGDHRSLERHRACDSPGFCPARCQRGPCRPAPRAARTGHTRLRGARRTGARRADRRYRPCPNTRAGEHRGFDLRRYRGVDQQRRHEHVGTFRRHPTRIPGTPDRAEPARRHLRLPRGVAALLRPGEGRGVIINVSSIFGRVPMPWAASYSASKAGLAGFTEALRFELASHSDIEVCGVYPAYVDTPTYLNSAKYTGRSLSPVSPVVPPERVAEGIV